MSETTENSVSENPESPTVDGAISAFMKRWEDSPQAETSETVDESEAESVEEYEVSEDTDDAEDYEVVESDEVDLDNLPALDDDEVVEDDEHYEVEIASDDLMTTVKVGEEVFEVSVKDLKRLYGQEKSLTKKSQQVAEIRKTLEEDVKKNAGILQTLLAKAEEKLRPYAEIDMLLASRQMEPDDFAQLRKEAQAAYDDYQFLNQESDKYIEMVRDAQQQELKKRASEAIETLKQEIPDWSEDLYNKIRKYGVSQGISQQDIDQLVDPAAIKLVLKAMKYDQGKKVAVKKRTKAPQRVLKSGATKPQNPARRARQQAMDTLVKSGSTDAARDAFLARWSASD
jgi:hypothetical protein